MMNNPNWAEQLEAIATAVGAIFALTGIFIAWKALRKDMAQQQEQIDDLIDFAKSIREHTDFRKEVLKDEIKPHFRKYDNHVYVETGKFYLLKLINDGGDYAYIHSITVLDDLYNLKVKEANYITQRIEKGGELHIEIYKFTAIEWEMISCDIILIFSDRTKKNHYKQVIKFQTTKQFKVSELEQIVIG